MSDACPTCKGSGFLNLETDESVPAPREDVEPACFVKVCPTCFNGALIPHREARRRSDRMSESTRTEELRDRRWNNGEWQTESLNTMFRYEVDRAGLIASIDATEALLPELEAAATKAASKADRANAEAQNRAGDLRRARDDLDIYKILLAEIMEIPK